MAFVDNMNNSNLYQVTIGYVSGTTSVPPYVYMLATTEAEASAKALDLIEDGIYNGGTTGGEYVLAVTLVAKSDGVPAYIGSHHVVAAS